MKKKFFFILLIILIVIIFNYNNYYEHFSVKVQDAMIFKDYKDKTVGTYPDINLYPDIFTKSNGKYINLIGTVHGVSEIKMSQPKDGRKGLEGDQGKTGIRGMPGPDGKNGLKIVTEDVINNVSSLCIAPGGTILSRMCEGSDGNNPKNPTNGTDGEKCPHPGGFNILDNGFDVYYGGKCPDGKKGKDGLTCKELTGNDTCPEGAKGPPGDSCNKVNTDIDIVDNKSPDGDIGPPGKTCLELGNPGGKCPVYSAGIDGQTCYGKFGRNFQKCSTESTPGVDSVTCMDSNDPNVKKCGRNNPDKVNDVANNLIINKYDGNTLTIDNNSKDIILSGDIILPDNGKIIFKDENNEPFIIDKNYIDKMILISKKCRKCSPIDGKNFWNNSKNCEEDQGSCQECNECKSYI